MKTLTLNKMITYYFNSGPYNSHMPLRPVTESTSSLVGRYSRTDSGVFDLTSHHKIDECSETSKVQYDETFSNDKITFNPPIPEEVCNTDIQNEENTRFKQLKEKLCPPRGKTAKWVTWGIICLTVFGMTWSMLPEYMKPNENIFGLIVTILLCFISEILIEKIPTCKGFPRLPRLLASLLVGVALANLPSPVDVASYIDPKWSWTLRTFSLAVILTNAGLELDPKAMGRVKWAVIRLAFLPCLGESITIAIFGHVILKFPWVWSLMLGFLIAAVSPAVVIPSLILLQEKGLGVDKGVPSLVMAASGIDDVLAIAGFTVLLGIAMPTMLEESVINSESNNKFNTTSFDNTTEWPVIAFTEMTNSTVGNITKHDAGETEHGVWIELAGALVEVVIGVVAGLVCGFFISYIPHNDMRYKSFCRGTLLLGIGVFAVFASDYWGIPGSGALWAIVTSFVAAFHWKNECKPLEKAWHYMWIVFQPILFGLTGATIRVEMLDGKTVGLGIAVLLIGLLARSCVSTGVTWGLNLNIREKAFISIAWIPKGTVQAALGSAALDAAIALNRNEQEIRWGEQVLVLAVLATLLTAPAGAFGISLSGPKLLSSSATEENELDQDDVFHEEDVFKSDDMEHTERGLKLKGEINNAIDINDESMSTKKDESGSVYDDDSFSSNEK